MQKKNNLSIGEAIQELIATYQLSAKLNEVKVVNAWKKVVGSVIDKHTTNIYVKNEVLHVYIDSAVIKQELSYSKNKLVQQLNQEAGSEVLKELRVI